MTGLSSHELALRPAFLTTAYGPVGRRIRLVERPAALPLPAWLEGRWAIVTAWNPRGQAHSPALNREAQFRLLAAVRAAGLSPLAALNGAGEWAEDSLLIPGATLAQARDWGRHFGQLAVLYGVGRRAALVGAGGRVERHWAGPEKLADGSLSAG